jgi:hypothetical protein
MFEIEENRYPFDNVFEFVSGGYWAQVEALHLTLGWIFIFAFIFYLVRQPAPLQLRLAIPYFALALFTNPAYEIAGLKINDVFGVMAALYGLATSIPFPSKTRPVASAILLVFCLGALHSLIVTRIYPVLLDGDGLLLKRVAINFKVFVLGVNLLIIGQSLHRGIGFNLICKSVIVAGTFGLLMYLLQIAVLIGAGTLPYGTYVDAGFIGVPSFGSVSEERGHFGKFMTPLFPFFLYALVSWRWQWRFALFVLVTCINISASSLVYFFVYSLISLWMFRRKLTNSKTLLALSFASLSFAFLILSFNEVFLSLAEKIYQLAIAGDESSGGGRSVGTFLSYISAYPFGIGYSGSSLRTAPGLLEINSGFFAFFTQYSLLALPILLGYAWLIVATLRKARNSRTLLGKTMAVGVIGSVVIFAADILWFMPTIWLAFEIAWAVQKRPHVLKASDAVLTLKC